MLKAPNFDATFMLSSTVVSTAEVLISKLETIVLSCGCGAGASLDELGRSTSLSRDDLLD